MRRAQVARDISYASSAQTRGGRAVIRTLETLSGRMRLIQRAQGYEREVAAGRDFWKVMAERYGLSLEITRGGLCNIPRTGPLIVVANHPYGILDGLMMGHILRETRGEFRILANSVFQRAEELSQVVLPVSFDGTKEAVALNLATRKAALDSLAGGGAIGIFPGGTVSTAPTPMARAMDPSWRSFTARMLIRSGATVVPVFFEGECSRLFQWASHLHVTLRIGLLIKEFNRRVDAPVRVAIGAPITPEVLAIRSGDAKSLMEFLRRKTYELSHEPIDADQLGYEFN